jgi:membrane-associated protein
MDGIHTIVDWFLHLDEHLKTLINDFGVWTYVILFLIIFAETGLVILPFLPGDSLLFAAGALASLNPDDLRLDVLLVSLTIAAIAGDTINYWFGRWIGPKAFSGRYWFLKQEHLLRTQAFYVKHGGKTIILARFVPIVRTFAPFVAGVGVMNYRQFVYYNIVGGIAWVWLCTLAGYLFGNIPIVKENFELVVVGIIVVSVLPLVFEYLQSRRHAAGPTNAPALTPAVATAAAGSMTEASISESSPATPHRLNPSMAKPSMPDVTTDHGANPPSP